MTSRERVEKVLNHELPDFLPNCWGGCETTGLHILAYRELVQVLGLPERPPRVDTFMFNAVMDEDVLLKMNGDLMLIASPNMCARPLRGSSGWKLNKVFDIQAYMTDNYSVETDENGMSYLLSNGVRRQRCPKGGTYFDSLVPEDLLSDEEVPDPADYHPRHTLKDELLRSLEETAKAAYENTGFALCMGETLTDLQLTPGGMVPWYEVMINEPEIVHEYLEKATDAAMDQLVELDQAVGKYCSMLSIAHDLGDNRGVTMGPDLFRQLYKPHYKRYFDGWHKRTKMKINLHSCGSVAEIIPDLIECGTDVLNPVQISAAGMSAENIRALAGDRLVLYGGAFDCIQTPDSTNPDTVYEQAKANIETLAANGNYLFAGVHNTVANTPKEHIEALLRAYQDMRDMYQKK